MTVTETDPRVELVEALAHMNYTTKRQQCIVGSPGRPTPWDDRHADLNQLLDALEAAPDAAP